MSTEKTNRQLVQVLTVFLKGMRCAFGKNVGTAARVKRGQRVISLQFTPEHYLVAKDALRKASMKFPTPCTTKLIRGHEHVKGLV